MSRPQTVAVSTSRVSSCSAMVRSYRLVRIYDDFETPSFGCQLQSVCQIRLGFRARVVHGPESLHPAGSAPEEPEVLGPLGGDFSRRLPAVDRVGVDQIRTGFALDSAPPDPGDLPFDRVLRSEEHTSELQSQLHLLFPLFFFNDTATTEIYTLSLHDALPIFGVDQIRTGFALDSAPPDPGDLPFDRVL